MINIDPLELMWKYITLQLSWKTAKKKELLKAIVLYPIFTPIFLVIIGFFIVCYYIGRLVSR
jgi:hypothetical protein